MKDLAEVATSDHQELEESESASLGNDEATIVDSATKDGIEIQLWSFKTMVEFYINHTTKFDIATNELSFSVSIASHRGNYLCTTLIVHVNNRGNQPKGFDT